MSSASHPLQPAAPVPSAAPSAASATVPRHGFAFVVFLALNAVLFVRPAEVFEELLAVEIYRYLLLLALVAGLPAVLEKLTARQLELQPITLCVLALLPAVLLSLLSHLYLGEA